MAQLGEPNQNRLEIWSGENGASRTSAPSYPGYIARAGHHGSTFFEHVALAEQLCTGVATGPTLADGFWSVAVGEAAQRSIAEGAPVDLADVLPADFDADVLAAPAEEAWS